MIIGKKECYSATWLLVLCSMHRKYGIGMDEIGTSAKKIFQMVPGFTMASPTLRHSRGIRTKK